MTNIYMIGPRMLNMNLWYVNSTYIITKELKNPTQYYSPQASASSRQVVRNNFQQQYTRPQ